LGTNDLQVSSEASPSREFSSERCRLQETFWPLDDLDAMTNILRDPKTTRAAATTAVHGIAMDIDNQQPNGRSPQRSERWEAKPRPRDTASALHSKGRRQAPQDASRPTLMVFTRLFIATVDAVLRLPAPGEEATVRSANAFAREGDLKRFLEPTLQKLVKRGVLRSLRGPRGGYSLGRPRSAITLSELLDATNSEKRTERAKIRPGSLLGQLVDSTLSGLEEKWTRDLEAVSIEDLHRKMTARG
jgi:Rrf2 family protein